ncbi:MAG: hypothetical protein LBR80_16060 [Deltaproteobacteria bacterium]|jgi:hypothetical protein|nr:hypothetical protein [Deltaproteobacteria bacterium]
MPETDSAFPTTAHVNASAMQFQVVPEPSGPGLVLMSRTALSRDDPAGEAASWVKEAVGRLHGGGDTPELALVFGLGLGRASA